MGKKSFINTMEDMFNSNDGAAYFGSTGDDVAKMIRASNGVPEINNVINQKILHIHVGDMMFDPEEFEPQELATILLAHRIIKDKKSAREGHSIAYDDDYD